MTTVTGQDSRESLLSSLLSDDAFRPAEPPSLEEAGLPASLVESLVCKYLSVVGTASGRAIADHLCLPFGMLESVFHDLRTRQIIVHTGSARLERLHLCAHRTRPQPGSGLIWRPAATSDRRRCRWPTMCSRSKRKPSGPKPPSAAQLTEAFADISIELGPVREPGAGHQLRRGLVPVRLARATANRPWPGGSRCASASTSGFRRR